MLSVVSSNALLDGQTRARVLENFAVTGRIDVACQAAGISRQTHYNWLKNDPEYAAAFEEARLQAVRELEAEAWRRAREGVSKPIYQMGKLVGSVQEYSDSLMTWLLRGHCPERYNEKHQIVHSGDVDVNHIVKFVDGDGKPE